MSVPDRRRPEQGSRIMPLLVSAFFIAVAALVLAAVEANFVIVSLAAAVCAQLLIAIIALGRRNKR